MFSPAIRVRCRWALAVGLVALAVPGGCRRRHGSDPAPNRPVAVSDRRGERRSPESDAALLRRIEAFTGARTRIVWSECQNPKRPDPFSFYDDQALRGLDTADPRGERSLARFQGNYSRPLLSPDGRTVVFTRKTFGRQGDRYTFGLAIFRTDWEGREPVAIGEGYAVTLWREPGTGRDWVYAVSGVRPQEERTFEAGRLIRFPLAEPGQIEVVYEGRRLSPDNLQLSRDGRRACALLPWPNAGVLRLDAPEPEPRKYGHGCWPSMAPDNSHVAWVFDGSHRSATFFVDGGFKSWNVDFSQAPQFRRAEVYHPRWTNHPRFIVLTGPYLVRKGGVMGGGRAAQVHLGRLSPRLDRMEDWIQVSDDDLGEMFPDAWIEGGDKVALSGFDAVSGGGLPTAASPRPWPAPEDGLLFVWADRSALNTWRDRTGATRAAVLEPTGAARFGRLGEMLLDDRAFVVEATASAPLIDRLKSGGEASFEVLVLSGAPRASGTEGSLISAPGLRLALKGADAGASQIVLATPKGTWELAEPAPAGAFHFAANLRGGVPAAFLDGRAVEVLPVSGVPPAAGPLQFGGTGGVRSLLRVAFRDRVMTGGEIAASAAGAADWVAKSPPEPAPVRLIGRLLESSSVPALESIEPYTSSLVTCLYEVERVISGEFAGKRVLVKHWGLLNRRPVDGFPREVGRNYELVLGREADHPELKGARVVDDTGVFDLESWFELTTPRVRP